jgi:polysaccharide chain length determinant protein (PEP-CTERM system associated)
MRVSLVGQAVKKVRVLLRPYWHWRRVGLWVTWIVALLGWLVVFTLPDRFEAMTRIYVETENLLTPLLRNIAIQADVEKQLDVMQRTLLNRKNVVQVAHAADLDLNVSTEFGKERLYEWLARRINIKAEGHNLFTVTYTNADPRQARKVVETLLNIFVETNLGLNRSGMESARNFIESQIAEYEQKLKHADGKLADYKSKHADILSATGANFSSRYDGIKQELFAAKSRHDDAVVVRNQLQVSLEANPQFLDVDNSPQVTVTTNGAAAPATSARGRALQLQAELSQLEAKFTDHHPDVIAAKRALEQARINADQEGRAPSNKQTAAGGGGRGRMSNPVYEQVKLRLIQVEGDIAQAGSRVQVLTEETARLKGLAETAPRIEAELADLNRDYGVIKSKFEELLGRRESARLSAALEASDDKLHFRIIEPPQVPIRPSFPNRPLFSTGVLLIALVSGAAFMMLLQKTDDTVTSIEMLTEVFGLRVIGVVPQVAKSLDIRDHQRRNFAVALVLLLLAYLGVLALNHFVRFTDVMSTANLPAFIQRIRDYAG